MSYFCWNRNRWVRGKRPVPKLAITARPKLVRFKKKVDLRVVRFERILKKIKWWETRERRAINALKKLRKQKAYYERERVRPLKEAVADLQSYGFDDSDISKLVAVGGVLPTT